MNQAAGHVIFGSFDSVIVRQKKGVNLEIGQLLTASTPKGKVLLQVFNLAYGSQISQQSLELISGMKLEEDNDLEILDKDLRNYTLAYLKPLCIIHEDKIQVCKSLPDFFSTAYLLSTDDTGFLDKPNNPVLLGKLRSGSAALESDVYLDAEAVFSHHVLITAQTGKGKSNLMSCLISSTLKTGTTGFLLLDPHDEYYGIGRKGLKDVDGCVYYTQRNPPPGARTLAINIKGIKPSHFQGVVFWSDPQREAMHAYYKTYKSNWIETLVTEKDLSLSSIFHESTIIVLKRRIMQILNLGVSGEEVIANGIYHPDIGLSTINDILDDIEKAKAVIIDTSSLSSSAEILVGSIISSELFRRYQGYKNSGLLNEKPVASLVLEEAPRVLGKDILEQGPNVFSKIAREGRKFKVGITAITQLPSLIPRQILANINTKIILGVEMSPERKAIIESASHDLTSDDRAIASLDKGEAIVSSAFSKFAIPIKIPLFNDIISEKQVYKQAVLGLHSD